MATIFDGFASKPVPEGTASSLRGGGGGGSSSKGQTGDVVPVPPTPDGNGTIFVSVASYRDGERCAKTLQSIFENAADPSKIVVGLVEQNHPDDAFCIEHYCQAYGAKIMDRKVMRPEVTKIVPDVNGAALCPYFDQIRLVAIHHIGAKGPLYARSLTHKVLGNEEFCAQVDAHTTFVQHWDTLALADWHATRNEFAVLSTVPAATSEMDTLQPGGAHEHQVPRMCQLQFQDNGYPDYAAPADGKVTNLATPLLSAGWSAAFSFAKCHVEESAPYDPFAPYAKPIEQFSRYVRLWTRGYDTYTPTRNMVFHDDNAQPNGHGNLEWFKNRRDRFRLASIQRMKLPLGIADDADHNAEQVVANMGIYGLGQRRTVTQLADFCNIALATTQGNVGTRVKCLYDFVPYDASISPTANLWDNPTSLEPQPDYPLRTALTYYQLVEEEPEQLSDAIVVGGDGVGGGGGGGGDGIRLNDHDLRPDALPKTAQVDGELPSNLPPVGMLFILWIFGLMVWCVMFAGPARKGLTGGGSIAGIKKKTFVSQKDA